MFKSNTKSCKTSSSSSSSSSLKVADIIIGHTFSSNIIESSSIEISNEECSLMGKFFHRCSSDPSLEAEVLNDVGHVFLDMFTFVTKEGSIIARLLAVIGRLAFIASDYIPDHVIRPDELVFQMSMLAIASARLSQGLLPVASSMLSSSSSIREKKAYVLLFKQAGLPWNKYKHMVSSNAFSWVDLAPESVMINEDNNGNDSTLHWVYNGTVNAQNNNHDINVDVNVDADDSNIINQFTRNSYFSFDDQVSQFKTGNDGASLLKVDVQELQKLMNEDGELNDSVRNLLFKMLKQTWAGPHNNVTVQ